MSRQNSKNLAVCAGVYIREIIAKERRGFMPTFTNKDGVEVPVTKYPPGRAEDALFDTWWFRETERLKRSAKVLTLDRGSNETTRPRRAIPIRIE